MPMVQPPGITLLGLGPGDPDLLTRKAWELINNLSEIYVRTDRHPVIHAFPEDLQVISFDHLYEKLADFETVYAEIIQQVLHLGQRPQGVVYAVPGHPFIAETTSPEIYQQAKAKGIPVKVVEGLSFIEPTYTALGLDPYPKTVLLDAFDLSTRYHLPFPPDLPILIAQIYSRRIASEVKLFLMNVYPDDHPAILLHGAGTAFQFKEEIPLFQVDRSEHIGLLTTLYVPPLGPQTSFEALMEIVAHLRAPEGCPWDLEQTPESLRPHLLEETYEALEAIDSKNPTAMQEEFGDLLLMIAMQAQMASETGDFNIADILQGINSKLIRRHPHVFGDLTLDGVAGVITNWEKLKTVERQSNSKKHDGLLEGVPKTLPALAQSQEYQERASRAGFDWPDISGVFEKISEEIAEVRAAAGDVHRGRELGDLLFVIVRLASWYGHNAENILREANQRFRQRFNHLENEVHKQGRSLSELSLDEMNELWESAKKLENGSEN